MLSLILTTLLAVACFLGGIYFEKSNSISKVKPIKKQISSLNTGRTIVVDRTTNTERDEPYKPTEQEIKDMFNK